MLQSGSVDLFDPALDLRAAYHLDFPAHPEPMFQLVVSTQMLEVLCNQALKFARRRPVLGAQFSPPAMGSAAPWGYGGCVVSLASPVADWHSFAIKLPANGVYGVAEVLETIDVVARAFAYAQPAPWQPASPRERSRQPAILRSVILPRLDDSCGGIDLRVCASLQQWLRIHGERGEELALGAMHRAWKYTEHLSELPSTRDRHEASMSCAVDTAQGLLRAIAVPGAQAIGGMHVPPNCDDEIRAGRGYDMESTNLTSERKIVTALAGFCALWGAASPIPRS
jgi:hypothetical protein